MLGMDAVYVCALQCLLNKCNTCTYMCMPAYVVYIFMYVCVRTCMFNMYMHMFTVCVNTCVLHVYMQLYVLQCLVHSTSVQYALPCLLLGVPWILLQWGIHNEW